MTSKNAANALAADLGVLQLLNENPANDLFVNAAQVKPFKAAILVSYDENENIVSVAATLDGEKLIEDTPPTDETVAALLANLAKVA